MLLRKTALLLWASEPQVVQLGVSFSSWIQLVVTGSQKEIVAILAWVKINPPGDRRF